VSPACASCQADNAPDARFCSRCGASLRRLCASCGAEQDASAAFCSSCGAALEAGGEGRTGSDAGGHDERRVVSVLFADLAGSTAMGERLDPEDVRAVQSELFELINAEVERFGGVSEKFAGDAVLAVFGIPAAHEDDPERAVRAGLAVRDAFPAFAARVRARHGVDVGVRVGINTGEVVAGPDSAARGELMVSGDAVNVAARLQQQAAPGTVLVGERTGRASERAIEFAPAAAIAARGKEAPVTAQVAVAPLARPVSRGIPGLAAPLIGRDRELALLDAVADRVAAERGPQLVTLFGHAGVGKSRLVAEFTAARTGARVLRGRCLPYGEGIAYWPLAEIAKRGAGILDTDPAEVAHTKLRAHVRDRLGDDGDTTVADVLQATIGIGGTDTAALATDAEDVRRNLHAAWRRYFAAAGRDALAIVLIEDIHWAAPPMLDLIEQLAADLEDTAVMIVCPSRPEMLDARPLWAAGAQNATAINLTPLTPDQAARLVAALLDLDRLDDETRARILARAEGNPFFTEEIVRMLIERGAIERRNGGWQTTERLAEVPIPDSVHGVLAARIDLLEARPRAVLRRCAVVGRVFWPDAVAADEEALTALARRGLVSERPSSTMAGMREYAFKHALTRDVAYAALPRPERRRLHVQVAAWIERVSSGREDEVAELMAHHYAEAIAAGLEDEGARTLAVRWSLRAGDSLLRRGAVDAARAHFGRALGQACTEGQHALAELSLGRADALAADSEAALVSLASARRRFDVLGDAMGLGETLSWISRASWIVGRWDEALATADAAIRALEGLPESATRARALSRKAQIEMLRSLPRAIPDAEAALAMAERVGDRFAEANALVNLFTARGQQGTPVDPATVDRAIEVALACGAYDEAYRALVNFIWTAFVALPVGRLEAMADRFAGRLQHLVPPELHGEYLDLSRCRFILLPGARWDELRAQLDAPRSFAAASNRFVHAELEIRMALARGDLASVDAALPGELERAWASGEPQRIVPACALSALRAAIAGEREVVRDISCDVRERALRHATDVLLGALDVARALAALGETAELTRLGAAMRESLRPAVPTPGREIACTALDGLEALAGGRSAEAVAALERSRDLEAARDAPYDLARSELDLAAALDAAGAGGAAADARARAGATLVPLGCPPPV
jgi:class 3 adenylate cyclase/tetratricopeptide (TPR) repeat protein